LQTPYSKNPGESARPRAFVTGLGAVTCVGYGTEALWQAAVAGRSGLQQNSEGFCLGQITGEILEQTLSVAQSVRAKKPNRSTRSDFPMYTDHALIICAMQQAMDEAGWESLTADDAIIFGTTTGQIPVWEMEVVRYLDHKISKFPWMNWRKLFNIIRSA
jgi:3-oxoacyl-(acyl-carrier-protein) synthase